MSWRPMVDFEKGLAKTVRWYLDNRAWWEPLQRMQLSHARGNGRPPIR